jgi:uncharacterized repeat protein (TIGR01451 family)
MKTSKRVTPGRAAVLAAGLIAMPAVLAAGHPAKPPASKAPALSVSVSDGRGTALAGDKLDYTLTVRDTGPAAVKHLKVTQTLSPGLTFLSASQHGAVKGTEVTWSTALTAGGSATFRATAQVTKVPAGTARLAAVACATLPGTSRPAVCAAHLDRVPGAAAAGAGGVSAPAARPGGSGVSALVDVAVAVAALALCLLGAVAVLRRRARRRQDGPDGTLTAPRSGRRLAAAAVPHRVAAHGDDEDQGKGAE